MDIGVPTMATFVDFRKAFDCVQHEVLIKKLECLGLSCDVVKWVQSYLSCRQQRVYANGTYSVPLTITQGVPQGSVLGPLFYIVYANDLSNYIKNCNMALYAEDTVLFVSDVDPHKAITALQSDIDALSDWCEINGIKANTDKTKLMVFGRQKLIDSLPPVDVKLCTNPLQVVQSYKYLGVTLDSQLNYNLHVNKIISSVSSKLKQFQRMRNFLSIRATVLVYKSILEYGDILLSATSKENRKKLQTLQNKGLRCALNKGLDVSSDQLHHEAGLLKLNFRRDQHLLNFMFDWSLCKDNLKKKSTHQRVTRSSAKKTMKLKKTNTEKFKRSLAYRGPRKWNTLPIDLHYATSKVLFKSMVSNFIKAKAKSVNSADTMQT